MPGLQYGRDSQAPGGAIPQGYPTYVGGEDLGAGAGWLDLLKDFLLRNVVYTVPKPFVAMSVRSVLLVANVDNWLDQNSKLKRRRAWAVLNESAVVGNDIFVSSTGMSAVGQGGRVLAQGGSLSIPGGTDMNIHAFTAFAAVNVSFYQFS